MRTNAFDATAFRCLSEYNNIVNIYSLIYKKNYDCLIKDYLEQLANFDTPNQIRDAHRKRVTHIIERCRKGLGYVDGSTIDALSLNDFKAINDGLAAQDVPHFKEATKPATRGKDKKPRKTNKNIKLTDDDVVIPAADVEVLAPASPAVNFKVN